MQKILKYGIAYYKKECKVIHRFVNNYTNRVGCGFECAGIKTQA